MTPQEMYEDMVRIFGDKLPDLEHCPIEFAYYVKLYKYYHMEKPNEVH